MAAELEFERKFNQYLFLIGGIVSLVFGVLLITRTSGAIEIIFLLTGLWWLIEGLFYILAIFIDKSQWGWKLAGGILGVLAGLLVLNMPLAGGVIVLSLGAILLGILGVLFGIAALIAAFQGAGLGAGLFGVVSVIIGLLMMFNAMVSARVLIYLFAGLLILQGAVALFAAYSSK